MGFIKKLIARHKWDSAAREVREKKTHAAYLREKEKQEMRVQKAKAKFEADEHIRRLKERPTSYGALAGISSWTGSPPPEPRRQSPSRSYGPSKGSGFSDYDIMGGPSIFAGSKPKPKHKRKKKGKTITIQVR